MNTNALNTLDSAVPHAIDARRRFLVQQMAWYEAARSLLSELDNALEKDAFEETRTSAVKLLRHVPELSPAVRDPLTQLAERTSEADAAKSDREKRRRSVAARGTELGVTLDLKAKVNHAKIVEAQTRTVRRQLELLERRQAKWDQVCDDMLPRWIGNLLFGGLRRRLREEDARARLVLDGLPQLTEELAQWRAANAQCASLARDLKDLRSSFRTLTVSLGETVWALVRSRVQENTDKVNATLLGLPPFLDAVWIRERWQEWMPRPAVVSPFVTVGSLREPHDDLLVDDERIRFPIVWPFIGSGHHILITSDRASEDGARSLFLSLILRTEVMLPHHCRHLLLDPTSQGQAFPFARLFPNAECHTLKLHEVLEERVAEISRIIQGYLDDRVSSFEQVGDSSRLNEKFEFIFVAGFPGDYDRRSIELLQRISKNGPVAGKYLIIEHHAHIPLPEGLSLDDFANLSVIDPTRPPSPPVETAGYEAAVDTIPDSDLVRCIADSLAKSTPPEATVKWHDVVEPEASKWWAGDGTDLIETSVGRAGASGHLRIWFGMKEDRRPCAHGMLGAMTGSGKSNLYHVLICGLAARYSPGELQLYLVDGKDGVEFLPYTELPHCAAVSLNTSPELARSILTELLAEKERRNALFAESGVPDLSSYRRRRGGPPEALPRILLLVDEYQELFEDDRDSQASGQLLQLAQQGRSVGIHMLLGSQRFGVSGLLHQTAVFGNIHLRIAMKMAEADIAALTEFGSAGKRLIRNCDLPGKIVVNDNSGDDRANQSGKVALLPREEVNELVAAMKDKATNTAVARPLTSVFNGKSQPLFTDNAQFRRVLRSPRRPSPAEWERLARDPLHLYGLAQEDWYAAERPFAMWVGQQLNLYGHAYIVVRRQPLENVMVVGGNPAARCGMLGSMLLSLSTSAAGQSPPVVRVADRAPPGTPYHGALGHAVEVLSDLGLDTRYAEDSVALAGFLAELSSELSRRSALGEEERFARPLVCLLIGDAARFPDLRKQRGKHSELREESPLGKQLDILCAEGPAHGIHVCLGFGAFSSVLEALDRHQLERFRHRLALQMSEEDSFAYVRSRSASQLQVGGPTPVLGLYADVTRGGHTRFKPYSVESQVVWQEMLTRIHVDVKRWGDPE